VDDPGGSTYLAAVICLLLSAFFSGSEAAFFSSDLIKLRANFGNNKALNKVLRLKEDSKALLSSILLGNTLVNVMFSSLIATIVYSWFSSAQVFGEFLAIAIGTVLVLLFGEITPKLVATTDPEGFAIKVGPWFNLLQRGMHPFSKVLETVASSIARLVPGKNRDLESLSGARFRAAVEYGERSGLIRNDEKEMIYGVIESQDREVSEVMVPRPKMVALQEDRTALEMLELMLSRGFSRVPVFSDSKDNITGVVNIKEVAAFIAANPSSWHEKLGQIPARTFASSPYFVPETKKVADLLYEMKETGTHMAIVVDEFDGISGLVTLEDLIEEIVGDIQDEYDQEEPSLVNLGDGRWQVTGSMSLADFEDATGVAIDIEDCDTIAGLVMNFLDRVPVPGDAFCLIEPRLFLEVKEVRGPRIVKVLVNLISPNQGELKLNE